MFVHICKTKKRMSYDWYDYDCSEIEQKKALEIWMDKQECALIYR